MAFSSPQSPVRVKLEKDNYKRDNRSGYTVMKCFGAIRRSSLHVLGILILVLSLAGCGNGPEELFEVAQFEELQNNQEHARKLYSRILRDHPDSRVVFRARERLAAMDAQ